MLDRLYHQARSLSGTYLEIITSNEGDIAICCDSNAIGVVAESCDDSDCVNVECEGTVTVTGRRPHCDCDCEDGKYKVKPSFQP